MTHGRRFLRVRVGSTARHLEEHRVAAVFVERPVRGLAERLAGAEEGGGGAGKRTGSGRGLGARGRTRGGEPGQLCNGRGKHAQARHDLFQGALLRVVGLHADGCARATARSRRRSGRAPRALRCARRGSAFSEKKPSSRTDRLERKKRLSTLNAQCITTTTTPPAPRTARTYTPRARLRPAR